MTYDNFKVHCSIFFATAICVTSQTTTTSTTAQPRTRVFHFQPIHSDGRPCSVHSTMQCLLWGTHSRRTRTHRTSWRESCKHTHAHIRGLAGRQAGTHIYINTYTRYIAVRSRYFPYSLNCAEPIYKVNVDGG